MRLLIVQYGGDYRETFKRITLSGIETYHAQKYVIDSLVHISGKIEEVILFCCRTNECYNEVLQDGLRAVGGGLDPYKETKKLLKLIEEQNPTHLVIHAPIKSLFEWAINNRVKTIALLADSFLNIGLRRQFKHYFWARLLNNQRIEWIGNHGINACLSLKEIGVNPNKIIPYDWIHTTTPDFFTPKKLDKDRETTKLLYVGAVIKLKGVGEIIEAIAKLKTQHLSVHLQIAGSGEIEYFEKLVKRLNIEDCVEFLGLIANHTVINLMRKADIVIVPSRHEYPEGCPFTIYEAFCTRTPLIASDHPMFSGNLQHGINAMIFPAGNSTALAACVEYLLTKPELYYNLSLASSDGWKQLQIPVKWADLINRWLNDSSENQHWLFEHRLASGLYESQGTDIV